MNSGEIENRELDGDIGNSSKTISNKFEKDTVVSSDVQPSPLSGGLSQSRLEDI